MNKLDIEKIYDICNKKFLGPFYKELESFEEVLENIQKEVDFIQLYLKPRKNKKVSGEDALRIVSTLEKVNFYEHNMTITFDEYVDKFCDDDTKSVISLQEDTVFDVESIVDKDKIMCSVIEGYLLYYKEQVLTKKDVKRLKILLEVNKDRVIPESMVIKIRNSCGSFAFNMFGKYNDVRNDYINMKEFMRKQEEEAREINRKITSVSEESMDKNISKDIDKENIEILEDSTIVITTQEETASEISSYSRQIYEIMNQDIEQCDILAMMPVEGSVNYYRVYSEVSELLHKDINDCNELLESSSDEDKVEILGMLDSVNSNMKLLNEYYGNDEKSSEKKFVMVNGKKASK